MDASFDLTAPLWSGPPEAFFRDRTIVPQRQRGPHCVATALAMLTGQRPEEFHGRMNTQDPVSWSAVLAPSGMRLAYCPTDVRKLRFYLPELVALDDLFLLCYYLPLSAEAILADPTPDGWVCSSHVVVLHRGVVLDPDDGKATPALEHSCGARHTKRVFRVVPSGHYRGL
jgi:hypothetical protein